MSLGPVRLAGACALVGVFAAADARADHQIDLKGGFGYDSNPYELGNAFGSVDGAYTELEATVSAEGRAAKGWIKREDIGFIGQLFENGMHAADRARFYVRARGDSDEKYDEHGWSWSLRSQARDTTFVSRLTGRTATDDLGNDIGDRYDNLTGEFDAEWRLPGWKIGRLSLGTTGIYKNYWKDYERFGLDRLDYYSYALQPAFEIGDGSQRLRVRVKAEQREYFNRRVSDAAGDPVPGTDLRYRYYGGDLRFQYRSENRTAFEWKAAYEVRNDNGVGFADRSEWEVGADWSWRGKDGSRFSIDGGYSKRTFDNQVTGDPPVNDEIPEKKGLEAQLRYQRPFPFLDIKGFSLVAEADWEDYDNNDDPRFAYDRWVAFIGVRQIF